MDNRAVYAVADARQRAEARESAEALFARKSSPKEHFHEAMPLQEPAHKPRVLSAAIPEAERIPADAEERLTQTPKQRPRVLRVAEHNDSKPQSSDATEAGIPNSDVARVRTWAKHGMKLRDIAGMYGVTVEDVRQVLRQIRAEERD